MNSNAFSKLQLHAALLNNLTSMEYHHMTPIQAQSLPPILAGKDVIGQGKTGSGKTAAFGLGVLQQLVVKSLHVQALVLCPTRELANQVAKEIRTLARTLPNIKVLTLCGGMPIGAQLSSLEHGAHIIVGTPGRIEDHVQRESLKLQNLSVLVLDEADRMLEMGFQSALENIVQQTPKQRQTLLFSATFSDKIQGMTQRLMRQAVMIHVESQHDASSIEQHFYKVDDYDARLAALRLLLLHHQPTSAVVFCPTKQDCKDVTQALIDADFSVLALHGDLEQWERDQVMVRFSNQSVGVLVATDVAARGLDIQHLDMVVNFVVAQDPEVHVHRIGRTGRAGNHGFACSLFADKEAYKMTVLADYLQQEISPQTLPTLDHLKQNPSSATMSTLQIGGGKKQKIRAGDILGALTSKKGIAGKQVGRIHILDQWSYVAIERAVVKQAQQQLEQGKLKGKSFRIRLLS